MAGISPSAALLTVILLALAPFFAVMVTSFTKIVVSLSLLRNALGLQQTPPSVVINGFALILTLYVMYPVGLQMQARAQTAAVPAASSSDVSRMLAYADAAKEPLRQFLLKHSTPRERRFFVLTGNRMLTAQGKILTDTDFVVVMPAFTVSELSSAFQIGFLIFLPFLVIDLVVANVLMAMGMMMMSPTTVSLPFKLLLLVLIDGWAKIAHGLVISYI
jgi:type III secretion protein R